MGIELMGNALVCTFGASWFEQTVPKNEEKETTTTNGSYILHTNTAPAPIEVVMRGIDNGLVNSFEDSCLERLFSLNNVDNLRPYILSNGCPIFAPSIAMY